MIKKLLATFLVCVVALSANAGLPVPMRPDKIVPWPDYILNSMASVTQATSVSTGVTINADSGNITMFAGTIAAVTSVSFTVTNSAVQANSVVTAVVSNFAGTYVTNGIPVAAVQGITDGAFTVVVTNVHASNATGANAIKVAFAIQ